MFKSREGWIILYFLINFEKQQKIVFWKKASYSQLIVKVGKLYIIKNFLISLIYTLSLAANIIVYRPSQGTK